MNKAKLIKEFDAKYGEYDETGFGSCSVECELRIENIKTFLISKVEQAEKELIKEILTLLNKEYADSFDYELDGTSAFATSIALVKKLDELKKEDKEG